MYKTTIKQTVPYAKGMFILNEIQPVADIPQNYTGKPGKMRQLFPVQESLGILKNCQKVREF